MRILVVDDDPDVVDVVRAALERHGHAIDTAVSGIDAIWHGTEFEYDAIVLDIGIPQPDGVEVCRRLRKAERWAPILLLTGRDGISDRVHGLDAGADDYLAKPFDLDELEARLRALTRRSIGPRPTVLAAADVQLDPATRRVTRAGEPVFLSPKEFALLEMFLRRPGQVLSRSSIREHIWDFGYSGVSNVVDVYVGYLRQKLDRSGEVSRITTVRGVGYRFETGVIDIRDRACEEAPAPGGARVRDEAGHGAIGRDAPGLDPAVLGIPTPGAGSPPLRR